MNSRASWTLLLVLAISVPGIAGTLSGKVVDARGRPVPDLNLFLVEATSSQRLVLEIDRQGNFSRLLPPGEYTLFAGVGQQAREVGRFRLRAEEDRTLDLRLFPDDVLEPEPGQPELSPKPPASEADLDQGLREIRDYRVVAPAGTTPSLQEMKKLAESVNTFPAQKRGRFHGSVYEFHRNDNFDARNFFDPVGEPLPEYKRNQFGGTVGVGITRNMNVLTSFDGIRIIQGSTLLSHVATPAQKAGDFSSVAVQLVDPDTRLPLSGNRIPDSRIHPVARRLLPVLPDPNRDDETRNFVNSAPNVQNRDAFSTRFDYQWNAGSNFFARYGQNEGNHFFAHALPTFGSAYRDSEHSVSLSWNQKITRRLLVSSSLEIERDVTAQTSKNGGTAGLLASLGIEGVSVSDPEDEGYPDFRLADYASFGDGGLPVFSTSNRLSFDSSVSYTTAAHSVRVGGGMGWIQSNNNRSDGTRKGRFLFNGYYTGDAFADFLMGRPDSAARGIGSDRSDLRRRSWSLYARDQWKLNPRLTLSGGLTYMLTPPFRSANNSISGFFPLLFEPPLHGGFVIPGSPEASRAGLDSAGTGGLVLADRNDFAPSLGFAFRPTGSNRFVVRSSYGIYYSPLGRESYVAYLGRNYPFFYVESALSPVDSSQIDLSRPFETAARNAVGVRGIETNLRTAYIQYWSLVIEGEVARKWHLAASYEGNKGTHMVRLVQGNVPLPGPGDIQARRPNPAYGRFSVETGSGSYSRSAMNLSLERRLEGGLSLRTGYAWDVSINDTYRSTPSNPRNMRAERAISSYTPRHQYWANYIADLPFGRNGRFLKSARRWLNSAVSGWRLSGITRFSEGIPYSVISAGDPNNDGVGEDRPDRIGSGQIQRSERTIDRWFATEDFVEPSQYSFGNSGRNILKAPRYINWDLSVIKQFRLSDGQLMEFRLELFNAFNQVNFEAPYPVFGTSSFGKIFGARRSREMEMAVRYSF